MRLHEEGLFQRGFKVFQGVPLVFRGLRETLRDVCETVRGVLRCFKAYQAGSRRASWFHRVSGSLKRFNRILRGYQEVAGRFIEIH